MQKEYFTYEEAKRIVKENGIKTYTEYKSSYKELSLPAAPNGYYKGKGWTDWYDFLGNEKRDYPTYEEAKRIVKENGIKTYTEYKSSYKELGLPADPNVYYKGKGWTDWYDFLGNEKRDYPTYEEAKRIVKENGIKTNTEYKSSYKELGLPVAPNGYYKGKGWTDWYDLLGNEKRDYPTYEEAKRIVKENGIKTYTEYKSSYKELGLPAAPDIYYKGKGWTDRYDFLGNEKPSARTTKALTTLSIAPALLKDNAPLGFIYEVAMRYDKKMALEIEKLFEMSDYEERLNWIKEKLATLKSDTTPATSGEGFTDELSAMESFMETYDDTIGEDDDEINIMWEDYCFAAINRELIAEYDG